MLKSSQVKVSLKTLCRKQNLQNVPAISNVPFSSYDIVKNQKITGFYMHTDMSRTTMSFQAKISLDDDTKFIYEFSNNKPIIVYQQSHKYFSTELSSILLHVYDFLKKLGTMGPTSRTGTICVIYKFKLHKFRL